MDRQRRTLIAASALASATNAGRKLPAKVVERAEREDQQ